MQGNRRLLIVTVAVLIAGIVACAKAQPECFVEVAVYDSSGTAEEGLRITSVRSRFGGDGGTELLGIETDPVIAVAGGIQFIRDVMSTAPWIITLTGDDGRRVEKLSDIRTCRHQRVTTTLGETASQPHESGAWFERSGRLVGCPLDDDWWLRLRPMFGVPGEDEIDSTTDGYLRPLTGEFTVQARHGVRHMLLVGRQADPVKVFAVNLDAGSTDPNLGDFDLSDSCPIE